MKELKDKLKTEWGIDFHDEALLTVAFSHTSYVNEVALPKTSSNERLEFLGDAALQLTISEWLYRTYPDRLEGELSKLRASIVRSESLADFSLRCGFDQYLLLSEGESQQGGRAKRALLEDLFEAFLGALMIDQGFPVVKKFLYEVMIPQVQVGNYKRVVDYKTALQELLQVHGDVAIEYRVLEESGPAHAREYLMGVYQEGRLMGEGRGKTKKAGEQLAAQVALGKLEGQADVPQKA